jgi:hypothetical protein
MDFHTSAKRPLHIVGLGEASFAPAFETTGAGTGVVVVTGGGAIGETSIPALQLVSKRMPQKKIKDSH